MSERAAVSASGDGSGPSGGAAASEGLAAEALRLAGVRFSYGGPVVLRGVDLSVRAGELVALLGPNGAGKTTLLRLAAGSLHPSAGGIRLFGADAARISRRERARRVAVVPQEERGTFDFTVRETVLMGRAPHLGWLGIERPEDEEAVSRALAATATAGLAGARFGELSGGEKQRALLARALVQEAPLMLLDEPTAYLDLHHRLEVYRLVERLRTERGLTVVAASHDVNLAARFCPRLVLLQQGRVVADGPPGEVLTAENLRRVYDVEARIVPHPTSGAPQILLG